MLRLLLQIVLLVTCSLSGSCAEELALPKVASAAPFPALTKQFQQTRGWTGADGAYSVPVAQNRTLWLFGDTWIGEIVTGVRRPERMINNSAAWQDLDSKRPLRFFWAKNGKKNEALIKAETEDQYCWPLDGIMADGRLCLFFRRIQSRTDLPPPFQFEVGGTDLIVVQNPQEQPTMWKIKRCSLPESLESLYLGVSCLRDGKWIYVYGSDPDTKSKKHRLMVARIEPSRLLRMDMTGWQFQSRKAGAIAWSDKSENSSILLNEAAPEMSVSKVRGIQGFIAVFMPAFSNKIFVSRALRPEGPWSAPVPAYECPAADRKYMLYSAKNHPELARDNGELVVTYCRNTEDLAGHIHHAEVYFPQGVRIMLRN